MSNEPGDEPDFSKFRGALDWALKILTLNNSIGTGFNMTKSFLFVVSVHFVFIVIDLCFVFEKVGGNEITRLTELGAMFVTIVRSVSYMCLFNFWSTNWDRIVANLIKERNEFKASMTYISSSYVCSICSAFSNLIIRNEYRLPINVFMTLLPFGGFPLNWFLNYAVQFLVIAFGSIFFYSFFPLTLVVINHTCWGIEICTLMVDELNRSLNEDFSHEDTPSPIIKDKIKSIVKMTRQVQKWQKEIQSIIRVNLLVDFTFLSVLFCTCFYKITTNLFGSIFILLLLNVLLVQLFVYCWLGTRFITLTEALAIALYNTNWHLMEVSQQKDLQMIIVMTQNMKGYHGIFNTLKLDTFLKVIQFSYSLLAVLRYWFFIIPEVSMMLTFMSYGLSNLNHLELGHMTELSSIFFFYTHCVLFMAIFILWSSNWQQLIEKAILERNLMLGSEVERNLTLKCCRIEVVASVVGCMLTCFSMSSLLSINLFMRVNEFRLPLRVYIVFLPFDDISLNWLLNYLMQVVVLTSTSTFFVSYFVVTMILINQSVWGVDITILFVKELDTLLLDSKRTEILKRMSIARHIKKIVTMTHQIKDWQEEVQGLMKFNFLIEFSFLASLFCMCVYVVASNFFEHLVVLMTLFYLMQQLFLYCWMGSRYITRIENLTAAIYDTKWYLLTVPQQKDLQMIILLTQNMKVFNGIVESLSLESFLKVTRLSYGLFVFLISFKN